MKLLFDENLSPRLPLMLVDVYPDSAHVRSVGLLGASDQQIWAYARINGLVIVSKDTDFRDRSLVEGAPPKVVWLATGNAGTMTIQWLLRRELPRLLRFLSDSESTFLHLTLGPSGV